MTAKPNRAVMEFESRPDNLGFARVAVASFASSGLFTLEELDDIKLAVSEAVSNCIMHAYPEGPGPVTIELEMDGTLLSCVISDRGVGIADLDEARSPGFSTDPDRMGMGFTLMEALARTLDVESASGHGTTVTMTFSPECERAGES